MMGRCIKPKIRSAKYQHEKKPASTPTIEKMIRFLNSSRWTRSGIACASSASGKEPSSVMENPLLANRVGPLDKGAAECAPARAGLVWLIDGDGYRRGMTH